MNNVGVVVIGRNEGDVLKRCITSLAASDLKIVYVDSGSTDGSSDYVESLGFDVVALDMSIPFSAARARNEGYHFLIEKYQMIDFIQFVDGDCEVSSGWVTLAYEHLNSNDHLAAVCGRRKERYPDKTLYNKFCDLEWDTPIGLAMATGGDFMCRKEALVAVDGFRSQVIAGEEPEMCFRMRQLGWKIERLDADMTLHDANMTKFSQWWKRNERCGHAYAQGVFLHGRSEEKYYVIDLVRILLWSVVIPSLLLLASVLSGLWLLLGFLIYPAKAIHIFLRFQSDLKNRVGFWYACSLVGSKFPQMQGVLNFYYKKINKQDLSIIEYKG